MADGDSSFAGGLSGTNYGLIGLEGVFERLS